MLLSPWLTLASAVPVLLIGEQLAGRVRLLSRFNIPAPVVGGLGVCVLVLIANIALGPTAFGFENSVDAGWWTWIVLPETQWVERRSVDVSRPFLVGFFACIGLNASAKLLKSAGRQIALLLALVVAFIALQNTVGVGLALLMGQSPLLGLLCGSVSLTGGHGTAIGFGDVIAAKGLGEARVVGITAATFGLVAAGLMGGPCGGWLIRRFGLRAAPGVDSANATIASAPDTPAPSDGPPHRRVHSAFLTEAANIVRTPLRGLSHLLVLAFCLKAGAWLSLLLQERGGITFPVYMGAMIVGIGLRNGHDLLRRNWLNTKVVGQIAVICLGVFLTNAMMSLNLIDLSQTALPMVVILFAQVFVTAAFAMTAAFWVMGRDYEAAVIAAGYCGFGMGATPAAIANMESIVARYGPAPRAFLLVPLVGAFLLDFPNALMITALINFLGN